MWQPYGNAHPSICYGVNEAFTMLRLFGMHGADGSWYWNGPPVVLASWNALN